MTARYLSMSFDSERLDEIDEDQTLWHSEDQTMEGDDGSSVSSSPSIPDEDIDFDLVYALHTFAATVEGQASVVKGDALVLMEDTNIYWWLVEVIKSREIGYIPAENIETPYERLARLNKHRNIEITCPSAHELNTSFFSKSNPTRQVMIADESMYTVLYYEVESEIDPDEQSMDGYEAYTMEEDMTKPKDEDEEDEGWYETPLAEKTMIDDEGHLNVEEQEDMPLRVFAGNIGQGPLFHTISIQPLTTAEELLQSAIHHFGLQTLQSSNEATIEYYLAVQGTDGDDYILSVQDKPYSIFKTLTDSLTTPMPSLAHIRRISHQPQPTGSNRRPRSSSFSSYEQTAFDEDSVIRFYLHRRIKRADEREGLVYIKVSLCPDHQKKKLEIDRIDKIIPVRQNFRIGDVIHLALEKFHVPDAQASDFIVYSKGKTGKRHLTQYKMFVRGNHQEVELEANEFMSSVLLQQKNASAHSITSDLLFILRKGRKSTEIKPMEAHPSPAERRPSILDILMENTPFNERHPMVSEPSTRLTEQDRRQYNNIQQSSFTSLPFSSNKHLYSSFSSIDTNQMDDMKQDKKKESLRQQFKRFVGWGTTANKKQQPQMVQHLTQSMPVFTASPTITPSPTPTSMSVMLPASQTDVLPPSVHHSNSSSDLDSISVPSTPLPPPTLPKLYPDNPSENMTPARSEVDIYDRTRQNSVVSFDSTSSVSPEEIAAATSHAFEPTESDSDTEDHSYHEQEAKEEEEEEVKETGSLVASTPSLSQLSSHYFQPGHSIAPSFYDNTMSDPRPSSPVHHENTHANLTLTTTTTAVAVASAPVPPSASLHPMPHHDLDDLFLLVAHGIDFLTTKENTRWEEEGGYDFHPWNRPESSFAKVRQQEKKENDRLSVPSVVSLPKQEEQQQQQEEEQEEEEDTDVHMPSSPSYSSHSSSSQMSLAQKELPTMPSRQSMRALPTESLLIKKQAVDDEELQRIVASHIVF